MGRSAFLSTGTNIEIKYNYYYELSLRLFIKRILMTSGFLLIKPRIKLDIILNFSKKGAKLCFSTEIPLIYPLKIQ